MGAMQILNRAYVIARAGETDAAVRAARNRYTRYKILLYAAAAKDAFGRERLAGTRAAVRVAPGLLDAAPDQLTTLYLKLRDACFDGEG